MSSILKNINEATKKRKQQQQENKWRVTTDKGESIHKRNRREQHKRIERISN